MTYSQLIQQLEKIKKDEELGDPIVSICVDAEVIVIEDVVYDVNNDMIIISDISVHNTESVL